MRTVVLLYTSPTSHCSSCNSSSRRHVERLCQTAAPLRGRQLRCGAAQSLGRAPHQQLPHRRRQRRGNAVVIAATAPGKDYYSMLGVSRSATAKEVKAAFRKKALKLHPDVNKAPDAKEQFMAAKEAFQVLWDADARARYDRQQRGGFDWGDPFGTGSSGRSRGAASSSSSSSSSQSGSQRQQKEEEFYGFGQFFSDLEREWGERRKRRQTEPASLWEELADLGEEFVEFLERELNLPPLQAEEAARNSDAASRDAAARQAASASQRAESASQRAAANAQAAAKKAEHDAAAAQDEVEDMLADLKRKMGK